MRVPRATLGSLAALALAFLLGPCGEAADDVLLPRAQAREMERLAVALARKGASDAAHEVLAVLGELRHDAKRLEKTTKDVDKALARARRKGRLGTAIKGLRATAAALADTLAEHDEDGAQHLARCILRLDASQPEAHACLRHVQHGATWIPHWMPRLLEGRRRLAEEVRAALRLEVEVATSTVHVPVLHAFYGRAAACARSHGVHLYSCTMSEVTLARIVRQVIRALSLSRALTGMEPLKPTDSFRQRPVYLVLGQDTYKRAIREATACGALKGEDAKLAPSLASFWDGRGYLLASWHSEAYVAEGTFYYACLSQLRRANDGPHEFLLLGHMNWIALRIIGIPINDAVYFDESVNRGSRTLAGDPDPVRRERMARIAKAGLRGSRSWLAYLTRRGAAPAWRDTFPVDQLSKIRGDDRIKHTTVHEFLQEAGLFLPLWHGTRDVVGRPEAIGPAVERELGYDLTTFERRFRAWLLPENSRGLVQILESPTATAAPASGKQPEVLAVLEALRKQAMPGASPLWLDEDLSRGALLHARYLLANPEQQQRWPDAHEEYPDRDAFTPEGGRAGLNGVIAFGNRSPRQAIHQWMGTFFHRLPLLHPGLVGVGWGLEEGIAVLDCSSLLQREVAQVTVSWPPDGAQDVPRSFHPELPNPVPGEDQSRWGYPVTFQYNGYEGQSGIRMSLYEGASAGGTPVDCHFLSPDEPKHPLLAPAGAWCLIPKSALRAGQVYTAVVEGYRTSEGVRSVGWSFRTGS